MNFVRTKYVIKKLTHISAITMYGKGKMHEWKKICMFDLIGENIWNPRDASCLMGLNRLKKKKTFLNETVLNGTQMRIEVTS